MPYDYAGKTEQSVMQGRRFSLRHKAIFAYIAFENDARHVRTRLAGEVAQT